MKLPCPLAAACSRCWDWCSSPSLLFASVVVSFPAFLFQRNLAVLAAETSVFFLLALTRRGKLRLLPSVLMIAGITFFALFSPHGEVLARIPLGGRGGLALTRGALEAGLSRGVTLAGMVFLSQLALSPRIRLPGRTGAFVVEMFSLLDDLGREPISFKKADGGIFSALDRRLYQVYWREGLDESAGAERFREEAVSPAGADGVKVRRVFSSLVLPAVLYFLLWRFS